MIDGASVAVVVPAHDEERFLGAVLDTMPSFVDRIIVVDDGSCDATSQVVTARQRASADRRAPPLTLLRNQRRCGVGAAIARGYREARRQGVSVIAVMAGDGQMHPDDLRSVVEPVAAGHVDYVKGNRLGHEEVRRVMPLGRRLGSRVLAKLTSVAAGVSIDDSQCGYTAVSARALDGLDLAGMWTGYGYPNDIIGSLARAGVRIRDVEVRPVYRGERSGLRPWHVLTIGYVVARVAWRRLRLSC